MKTRTLIFAIIFLLVVYGILSGQSLKKEMSAEEAMKVLSARWVNTDYNSKLDTTEFTMAKEVISSIAESVDYYTSEIKLVPEHTGQLSIDEAWKDEEGDIWIKARVKLRRAIWSKYPVVDLFILYKIDKSRMIMEEMISFSFRHYTEIDISNENYRLYYRQ